MGSTKGQNLNIGSTAVFLGSSEDAGKPERRQKLPNRGTTEQAAGVGRESRIWQAHGGAPHFPKTTDQKDLHLLRHSSDDLSRRGSGSSAPPAALRARRALPTARRGT